MYQGITLQKNGGPLKLSEISKIKLSEKSSFICTFYKPSKTIIIVFLKIFWAENILKLKLYIYTCNLKCINFATKCYFKYGKQKRNKIILSNKVFLFNQKFIIFLNLISYLPFFVLNFRPCSSTKNFYKQ